MDSRFYGVWIRVKGQEFRMSRCYKVQSDSLGRVQGVKLKVRCLVHRVCGTP